MKGLATNFLIKVSKIFVSFDGYFEKRHFKVKLGYSGYFWPKFGKNGFLLFQHLVTLSARTNKKAIEVALKSVRRW